MDCIKCLYLNEKIEILEKKNQQTKKEIQKLEKEIREGTKNATFVYN